MKTLYAIYSVLLIAVVSITTGIERKETVAAVNCCDTVSTMPQKNKAVNWQDSLTQTKQRLDRKMSFAEQKLKRRK